MNWAQLLHTFTRPLKWWVVVATWERGVRVRFGKNPKLLEPGLHFRIPYVDRVYVQSVRLRTISEANVNGWTADGKAVNLTLAIEFAVGDMLTLYDSVSTPETTLLLRASEAAVSRIALLDSSEIELLDLVNQIQLSLKDAEGWGLIGLDVRITSYSIARVYRLLMNDYRNGSGMGSLDDKEEGGER